MTARNVYCLLVFVVWLVTIFTVCTAQIPVDHCTPNPCVNSGVCEERVDGFVCRCSTNYTGLHCDIPDYCLSQPCLHAGLCSDTRTGYVCDCTGTGYNGTSCELPEDDCLSFPCRNGGTCVDAFKSYTCTCIPGFAGQQCEVEMSACVSNPCQHGGTCIDVHAGSNPGQFSPSFKCQCVKGTGGDMCETNYDDCWMKPCQHGVCMDGVNSYTCDCTASGYSGVHCEHKNKQMCALSPCQNGGTCIQDGDDYHCDCLPFQQGLVAHGGKNCSVLLRGCENVHSCLNDGVCVPILENELKNIHSYKCSCAHGYRGKVCDAITTMSLSTGTYIRKTYTTDFVLAMRFRTDHEDGVLLYDRIGQSFVSVELVNGSLFLVSGDQSGMITTAEAFTVSSLGDSRWHSFVLTSNSNVTLMLDDKLCNTTDDCLLSMPVPLHTGSFREIFLGHVTVAPWLRGTLSQEEFSGCIQDVMFNKDVVVPSNFGVAEFHHVKMSCVSCLPRTCLGLGQCIAKGTDFNCACSVPLHNGVCPQVVSGIACDFEQDFCGWTQSKSDQFDWTRFSGLTGSTDTGPSGDHTTGLGHYLYTEASSPRTQGDRAELLSPSFDLTGPACLYLWVNMHGNTMGILSVQQDGRTVLSLSGEKGNSWFPVKVALHSAKHTRITIRGTVGSGYYSDMAIDDLHMTFGSCATS